VTIQKHGLLVKDQSDVIIHNIRFEDGDDGDAIQITRQASRVWVDHVSLKSYGDGLIDITRAATDITVSWCRFEDHSKVMLISASVDHTDDKNIRVTLHHNYFNETVQRHPRLRYGKVHAYNNYLKKWTGYGMGSSQDGELLSEHNIFEAGYDKDAVICQVGEDPRTGAIESRRDWQLNGAIVDENDTEDVFEARDYYSYTKEDADSSLRDKIKNSAGWQSVSFPGW
jgi:pectate lyase